MYFKFTGWIMLISSGLLMIGYILRKYNSRIEVLDSIIKDLNILKIKISLEKIPLYNIFSGISINCNKKTKKFYDDILNNYYKNDFSSSLKYISCYLDKEDINVLKEMLGTLGKVDYKNQINNIESAGNILKINYNKAKEEKEKNLKIKSAGIIGSIFVLIIISI